MQEQALLLSNITPIAQPNFITNNWRMIQAYDGDTYTTEDYKYITVKSGVVTVRGYNMILRSPLPLPDGHYNITERNEAVLLTPSELTDAYRFSKDVDIIRPTFNQIEASAPITRDEIMRFIEFLSHVRQENKRHLVVMGHEAAYMVHRQDMWYKFPITLPVKGDGLVFEANHLKLAFTEMLRYDHVFIGRDNRFGADSKLPLIIGLDWEHCALIMHKRW